MKLFLWLACLIPGLGLAQTVKFRKYKKGQKFHYQLTTESFRNHQPDSRTIAVSKHTVIEDAGSFAEEIEWITKTVFSKKDTFHLDSLAKKVPHYKISLAPGGYLKIPPLTIPEMTGEITDLHSFYVAISPALHIQQLGPNRLSFRDTILKGNFADGNQVLAGEDCIQVSQKLLIKDKGITIIKTSFEPPDFMSIVPFIDTIGKQLFNSHNNFQMVRKGAGGKVDLLWGIEEFVITSTLDNNTGQVLKADMINLLNLKMRYNCSEDLKTYEEEIPLTIRRVLQLVLLK
ncbi:MAG: hypothetical protein ACHQFX_03215 [Chitinophagales bacterium]